MNLPTTTALDAALPAAAAANAGPAIAPASPPATTPAAAAAATPRPATDGAAAEADGAQAGAFNALLASLGLLPTLDAAPQDLEATGDEPAEASAGDAAATLPTPLPGAGDPSPQPVPELTPAWRQDTAMLMASLPMAAVMPGAAPAPTAPDATAGAASGSRAEGDALAAIAGLGGAPAADGLPRTGRPAAQTAQPAAHAGTERSTQQMAPLSAQAAAQQAQPTPAAPGADARASLAGLAADGTPGASAAALREPASAAERSAPAQPLRRDDVAALVAASSTDAGTATVQSTASASAVAASSRPVPAHGPALLQALGDRLQVQIAQRSEHAVIRLDPQAMGSVEIVLRHEAGALQVHLSASHPDVQRQLQGISDALRQDLSQRQYTDVSVNVAAQPGDADGRRRQGGQPQAEERPGRALAEAEHGAGGSPFSMASSLE